MLIFTNANITYDGSVITIESNMTKDLEMKFIGANTFTSTNSHGIYHGGTGKLTIWSDEYNYGSLTINATTSGKIGIDLANKADVKINRLDLTVNAGSTAIASHFAPTTEVLTISNSNAKLHGERSAVKMKKVDLAFCQYESSYGIDGFNSEGRGTLAGKVQTDVKVKEDVYDIQVAGKKVTAKNARNILLDNNYSVYYDARENMLTLENANITTNANNAIHINSFQKTNDKAFKIRLIGKNTITHTGYSHSLYIAPQESDSTVIYSTNGGTLDINCSTKYAAVGGMEGSVTFKDCTVNVKNTNTEGSALKGLNGLTQSFSFINTHFTAQTAGTDVIREISDIRYYGCFMKTPAQGFLSAYNVLWSPDGAVNRLEIVPGKDNIEPFLYYGDTPKATAITNKTATIEFYGALDNFTYSKDIKYHVFLAKGPVDGTWDKSYDPDFIPSGSKLSTVITGLEEGTKYTLRMRAMDQNKNYTFYKDIEFTTSINEAPTLPENISLRWTCEGTTINVEWDPATDDFTPANKLTYWVEYKEVNQDSWYMKNVGNATSYTIEGLKPNTDYIVCVCVVDEDEKYTRYRAFMETTGDDPNAIDHVADATSATGKAYNLNGTPAGKNQRGVVIKNGKKIIQK